MMSLTLQSNQFIQAKPSTSAEEKYAPEQKNRSRSFRSLSISIPKPIDERTINIQPSIPFSEIIADFNQRLDAISNNSKPSESRILQNALLVIKAMDDELVFNISNDDYRTILNVLIKLSINKGEDLSEPLFQLVKAMTQSPQVEKGTILIAIDHINKALKQSSFPEKSFTEQLLQTLKKHSRSGCALYYKEYTILTLFTLIATAIALIIHFA